MVAYTTTYNLKKPTVADDEDVWGGYLNDSMDLIDDVLDGTTPVTGIDINSGTIDNTVIGGTTPVAGTFSTLTANTSLGVTGNITVSGTVDGRDVAADGTKLDGIESGATADQTKADIDALGINAATLDSLDSSQFLRSDAADTTTGTLTVSTSGNNQVVVLQSNTNPYIRFKEGNTDKAFVQWHSDGYVKIGNDEDASSLRIKDTLDFSQGGSYFTVWHAGNDGSGSGLDADLWDGNQFSSYLNQAVLTSSTPTFNNMNVAGYIAHVSDGDTYMNFGTNEISFYAGGSREITINTTGVRLGDTGNGYFQPVSGDYGSVQIDGGNHGGWEGYSIGGRAVFMHDNSTVMGLYDDANNHWALHHSFNGATSLYYDGSSKIQTTSSGVNIDGNLNAVDDIYLADQIIHEGDTNTYIQFHAADQWRVVTGGSERLEVNNTRTFIDRLFVDAGVVEDHEGLSGTTPTCNVNNGGSFSLTMTGNTTFTFTAPWAGSDSVGFVLQLTGNGSTVTWPSSVDWAGGTAPDAPASGETDIYVFWTRNGGTTWYGVQSIDAAA